MQFAFDLISDLHVDSWRQSLDWEHQATSPVCIIAGNVTGDQAELHRTLTDISKCYKATIYIDGEGEHINDCSDIGRNYHDIDRLCQSINNLVYLQDNCVIMNGVAVIGTNGWWTWDFDPDIDVDQAQAWFCHTTHHHTNVTEVISNLANSEAKYLSSSVLKLQRHPEVRKIVVVTNCVPYHCLIEHDQDLRSKYDVGVIGNKWMRQVIGNDLESKISHWCVGRYPGMFDKVIDGVRFVSNPRGHAQASWNQTVYFPRRFEIDI
jgi:hypothetical protein